MSFVCIKGELPFVRRAQRFVGENRELGLRAYIFTGVCMIAVSLATCRADEKGGLVPFPSHSREVKAIAESSR
jgi:hypothetical protein